MPGPADEGPFLDLLSTPETGCMGSWPRMLCVWRGGRMRHGAGALGHLRAHGWCGGLGWGTTRPQGATPAGPLLLLGLLVACQLVLGVPV